MPTTVTKTIGTAGGRDYSTLQAWEDACPADLTSVDQIWKGEAYNDSEFTAALAVAGITTDSTRYPWLTAATGQSFQDNANVRTNALRYNQSNGVGLQANVNYANGVIDVYITFFRLTRFQVKNSRVNNGFAIYNQLSGSQGVFKDLICESGRADAPVFSVPVAIVINVVAVANNTTGSGHGFETSTPGPPDALYLGCLAIRPSDITDSGSGIGFKRNYG